jgi:hypothetical protein
VGGGAGMAEMYEKLIMYCNRDINVSMLGQNQTTESTANLASSVAGQEVAGYVRDRHARMIEAAMGTLIRWIIEINYSVQAESPRWMLWEQEAVDELQARRDATLADVMAASGLRFTRAYLQNAYSLNEADLEEAVAAPEAEAPAAETPEFAEAATLSDAIALAAQDKAGEWEKIVGPALDDLLALLAETGDLEIFRDRLTTLLGEPPNEALVRALTNTGFAAAAASQSADA